MAVTAWSYPTRPGANPYPRRWSAARAARAMMVRAGLAEPWVGSTLPSVMYRFGTAKVRRSPSTTPVLGAGRHPGPADQVGVPLDGDHLARAGRVQDVLHPLLR